MGAACDLMYELSLQKMCTRPCGYLGSKGPYGCKVMRTPKKIQSGLGEWLQAMTCPPYG
eukprot:CAMPEP_0180294058 /NCGR_PEP_ID=MMETSP0988-20121125/17945_1 /TAXON_ID=697907 /ORGANISM="non described non described, Strain CCMP2293" /LENGTH=58 /DNA_ID=CAMNT_0022270909 /DNA_START=177 /DNA_END=353 /DNA_ORIENTATION=-